MTYYGLVLDGENFLGVVQGENRLDVGTIPWITCNYIVAQYVHKAGDTHSGCSGVPFHWYDPDRITLVEVNLMAVQPSPGNIRPLAWQELAQALLTNPKTPSRAKQDYQLLMEVNRELDPGDAFVVSQAEFANILSMGVENVPVAAVA